MHTLAVINSVCWEGEVTKKCECSLVPLLCALPRLSVLDKVTASTS